WIIGLPVPFMIIFANLRFWFDIANALPAGCVEGEGAFFIRSGRTGQKWESAGCCGTSSTR
ncbi:MAG: hypothetical protein M0Z81_18195, partial [Deltaproteobacteria bacterium]|nr:hypothetical protein [Deltaproteobacteria bacterium]